MINTNSIFTIPLGIGFTVVLSGLSGLFSPSTAQEYPGCFIEEGSGDVVNLTQSVCNLFPTASSSSANPSTTGLFQVPIKRREGGIPVIDVSFNGKTFEMLLDTGATGVVITRSMAEALEVQPYGVVPVSTASDRITNQEVGRVNSVDVGGLQASDVEVAISPVLEIGLLGQSIFGQYDVTIKQDVVELRARS